MTECKIWMGALATGGYGAVDSGGVYIRAHHLAYKSAYGDIPDGYVVHHTCGNRICVNPEHLQLVTPSEHAMIHNKRRKPRTHCNRGHEFTEENTVHYYKQRYCKLCKELREARL